MLMAKMKEHEAFFFVTIMVIIDKQPYMSYISYFLKYSPLQCIREECHSLLHYLLQLANLLPSGATCDKIFSSLSTRISRSALKFPFA